MKEQKKLWCIQAMEYEQKKKQTINKPYYLDESQRCCVWEKLVSKGCIFYVPAGFFGHSQEDKTSDGKQISSGQGLWVGREGHCKGIVQGISWMMGLFCVLIVVAIHELICMC